MENKKGLLREWAGNINDYSRYFNFHCANIGRNFQTPDGIKSKLQVWIEHKDFPSVLRTITNGKHKTIIPIDKPMWKNGVLKYKQNKNDY